MPELLLGMSLGLGAGINPGPLLALVIAATLERGRRAGLQVAVSPLVTDGPVIAVVLIVLHELPARAAALLALGGAGYVGWLAVTTLARARRTEAPAESPVPAGRRDLWRGALANLLSPHPWLFWIGIGGPVLVNAWDRAPAAGVLFLVGMFTLLVGSKMLLATLVAATRRRITTTGYRALLTASAVLMLVSAGAVVVEFWPAALR